MIKSFLDDGVCYFNSEMLMQRSGISCRVCPNVIRALLRNNIIEHCAFSGDPSIFKVNQGFYHIREDGESTQIDMTVLLGIEGQAPQENIDSIKQNNSIPKRLKSFLMDILAQGRSYFAIDEYCRGYNFSRTSLSKDLCYATDFGILDCKQVLRHNIYYIPTEPIPPVRVKGLTREMKELLDDLYRRYQETEFTSAEALKPEHRRWLPRFKNRGIMAMIKRQGTYVYRLLITPEDWPECFGEGPTREGIHPSPTVCNN